MATINQLVRKPRVDVKRKVTCLHWNHVRKDAVCVHAFTLRHLKNQTQRCVRLPGYV